MNERTNGVEEKIKMKPNGGKMRIEVKKLRGRKE